MAKEPKRISRCSLFAKSKKIGTAEGGSLTLNDNGEPHVTDEGWTQSDGTTTCEVKLNTIISVEGSTKFLKDALVNKEFITIQGSLIDGETFSVVARCNTVAINWDNKTGAMKGEYSFAGGEPTYS